MWGIQQFVIDNIRKEYSPEKVLLDIGCGPGLLKEEFPDNYVGVDITDEPYAGRSRPVNYICSADELTLDDNTVDIAVIESALFLFPKIDKSIQEAKRVLKPGGILLVFDYNRRTQKTLEKKEGHTNYPCWTQRQLTKRIAANGFSQAKSLLPLSEQHQGIKQCLHLLRQEIRGNWAIVRAVKPAS